MCDTIGEDILILLHALNPDARALLDAQKVDVAEDDANDECRLWLWLPRFWRARRSRDE